MSIPYTQKGYEKEFKTNSINEFLTFDGDVLGGVPHIKGTEIPAYKIFTGLSEGREISSISRELGLKESQIKGVLKSLEEMFQVSFYEEENK